MHDYHVRICLHCVQHGEPASVPIRPFLLHFCAISPLLTFATTPDQLARFVLRTGGAANEPGERRE